MYYGTAPIMTSQCHSIVAQEYVRNFLDHGALIRLYKRYNSVKRYNLYL